MSTLLDGLITKLIDLEEDLAIVERAIITAGRTTTTTLRLLGVKWNLQDQKHYRFEFSLG